MYSPSQRLLLASAVLAVLGFLFWTVIVRQGWTDALDIHVSHLLALRLPHRLARPGGHLAQVHAASGAQRLGDLIDVLGSGEVIALLVLVLGTWAWQHSGRYALLLLLLFAVGQGLEVLLKLTLVHPDPGILTGQVTAANSYFSGHTFRVTFAAATVALLMPRLLVLLGAVLLVGATAFGLLYLGQHWLSDIVGGALVGWATASGASVLANRRGPAPERLLTRPSS